MAANPEGENLDTGGTNSEQLLTEHDDVTTSDSGTSNSGDDEDFASSTGGTLTPLKRGRTHNGRQRLLEHTLAAGPSQVFSSDEYVKEALATEDDFNEKTSGRALKLSVVVFGLPSVVLNVKEDWTVDMVEEIVANTVQLRARQYFSLADTSNAVDRWLVASNTLKDARVAGNTELAFKLKFWKEPRNLSDAKAIEMMYHQVKLNVVSDKFTASETVAVRLASYQMQIQFGDYKADKHRPGFFAESGVKIGDFMAPRFVQALPPSYWERRLFGMHAKYQAQFATSFNAQLKYLELARTLPTYGQTTFPVTDARGAMRQIHVGEDGFQLFDGPANLISTVSYSQVRGMSESHEGFELLVTKDEQGQGDAVSYTYRAARAATSTILELMRSYFLLLVRLQERTLDGREARLDSFEGDLSNVVIPPESLYVVKSSRQKEAKSQFASRADVFKAVLTGRMQDAGVEPWVKLWRALDDVLDHNTWLEELDCGNLGMIDSLANKVLMSLRQAYLYTYAEGSNFNENLRLTAINLSNNSITDKGCQVLARELRDCNVSLERFSIAGNKIGNHGVSNFVAVLVEIPTLKYINMSGCGMEFKGFTDLIAAVEQLPNLHTLMLADNKFGEKKMGSTGQTLTNVVQNHPKLTHLDVSNCKLSDSGAESILKGLEKGSSRLISLNMANNGIKKSMARIAQVMTINKTLRALFVGENNMPDDAAGAFADMMQGNSCLRELSVAGCSIKKSVPAFFSKVAQNKSVISLDVSDISLDPKKAGEALVMMLATNSALVDVSLSRNKLGGGKVEFQKALVTNAQLVALNLSDCQLKHEDFGSIAEGLKGNRTLRILNLSINECKAASLAFIGEAIGANTGLHTLNLDSCKVADNGVAALAQGLLSNKTLSCLSLAGNIITQKGFDRLVGALTEGSALKAVVLEDNKIDNVESVRVGSEVIASIYL